MEFFGIPVNDEILSNPRPENVLGIGKQFVGSEVYDDLLSPFQQRQYESEADNTKLL